MMADMTQRANPLPPDVLLQLSRFNTPTIYNGWEQITHRNSARECFNLEPVIDFFPDAGAMVGYAVTVVIEPGNPQHKKDKPTATKEYREYVGQTAGPKIVVVQDLDKPKIFGAFWGEVNSTIHRALGCVGTITDGGARDLDESQRANFKILARGTCVGHAAVSPIRWNCPVEVFGQTIQPGQLLHADKHGFLAIPPEDEARLLEAAQFMDQNETSTVLSAARSASTNAAELLAKIDSARTEFSAAAKEKFARKGEW
jgi:4-hydroxy-4-methyl-2-oxoglutarate aldolase